MGVLAEYLRTEAENLRAERQKRKEAVEEWKQSLIRLYEMLTRWIAVADNGQGLIGCHADFQLWVEEPRLGAYSTNKLTVYMGALDEGVAVAVAEIAPRARFVAATLKPNGRQPRAADGMVMLSEGQNSRIANHYLFRWKQADGDEWFICSDAEWNSRDFGNVHPLTPETFEAAVLSAVR